MKLILLLAFTLSASAQEAPRYPNYFVSMGGGYTRNAEPNAAEGWLSGAIQIGSDSPYYSITTIDMNATTSSVRTGFAKVFAQSGATTLMGRVDAGISTITPVVGSFTGGAILLYDLGRKWPKFQGNFLLGEVRISGVTAATSKVPNQVVPGFYFGFGKTF